jgi:hypothetical protein
MSVGNSKPGKPEETDRIKRQEMERIFPEKAFEESSVRKREFIEEIKIGRHNQTVKRTAKKCAAAYLRVRARSKKWGQR